MQMHAHAVHQSGRRVKQYWIRKNSVTANNLCNLWLDHVDRTHDGHVCSICGWFTADATSGVSQMRTETIKYGGREEHRTLQGLQYCLRVSKENNGQNYVCLSEEWTGATALHRARVITQRLRAFDGNCNNKMHTENSKLQKRRLLLPVADRSLVSVHHNCTVFFVLARKTAEEGVNGFGIFLLHCVKDIAVCLAHLLNAHT